MTHYELVQAEFENPEITEVVSEGEAMRAEALADLNRQLADLVKTVSARM